MALILAHVSLALSAFLSSTLLPGTSEVALLAMASQWPGNVLSLFAVATLANTAGSGVNYGLGRGALQYADRSWFPISRNRLDQATAIFQRFGLWSLLFAWVPIVGDPLTLAAGVLRVKVVPFFVLVAAGKLARYAALMAGFLSL
jgi:membrane protein YqaA with SNARE-associated domain